MRVGSAVVGGGVGPDSGRREREETRHLQRDLKKDRDFFGLVVWERERRKGVV